MLAGARRRRVCREFENSGWRPNFDCRSGAGNGTRGSGSGDEIRETAEAVRAGHQRISGNPVQVGGDGYRGGGGEAIGLPGGLAGGSQGRTIYEGIEQGETVCQRSGGERRE